jgi:hypothetical protein
MFKLTLIRTHACKNKINKFPELSLQDISVMGLFGETTWQEETDGRTLVWTSIKPGED